MSEDAFRWIVAVGVVLACLSAIIQAVLVTILYRTGKKAAQTSLDVQAKAKPIISKVEAILTTASQIVDENRPRINDVTAEVTQIAKSARQQADRIAKLLEDAEARTQARVEQIDQTVGQTVEQVEQATEAVKSAVLRPVKEANGIVAGVKAALATYARGGNRHSPDHITQDEEMFI